MYMQLILKIEKTLWNNTHSIDFFPLVVWGALPQNYENMANNLHPSFKFTLEFFGMEIFFLDTLIIITSDSAFAASVYSKPTDNHIYSCTFRAIIMLTLQHSMCSANYDVTREIAPPLLFSSFTSIFVKP